ncbi:MAG: PEP-CTERM sorting domain-containing protein [Limnospira sp.]
MKKVLHQFALISGATIASLFTFALSANAAVFYDLNFWNGNGKLVGTGEFSHEDEPFEKEICLFTRPNRCDSENLTLNITKEDGLFRVDHFSSTIPGLTFDRLVNDVNHDEANLFWRNVEDNPLASLRGCTDRECFRHGGTKTFSDNSWFDAAFFAEYNAIQEMTATGWRSAVLGGSLVPPEAQFDLSGTWTATRRTSVPEPASIFGLMALGALGTSSILKRNRH